MKIIDKTPFQDESGQISFTNRIQGTLKFGLSWYSNLEAQKTVISILNPVLEKGYTMIRNQKLGASEIIAPLVLIGPAGIFLIEATPLKGFYRARGDEWGTVSNGNFQPASINIIQRAERLAKVLQVYYERQGVKLAAAVEPVLIAIDPGMQIESVRPNVRVVMSDAVERFAASLLTARPVYNAQTYGNLVERLINPHPANKPEAEAAPEPAEQNDPFAVQDETPFSGMEASRLQSILNAPKSDALIDSGQEDIGFAFAEADTVPPDPTVMVKNPPQRSEASVQNPEKPKRILGLTPIQFVALAVMFLCWCGVMAIGGYLILQSQP